ncbi:MAG TPA: DNA cytosine methyltransferase [Bryobacteraceae bacterium]|nr:DNA cytosine methyltransferase [Bryobacteraceae bacterium]
MPTYYEFFAGGGMVRAGLGERWSCLFANDIDAKKAAVYTANWGGEHLSVADIRALTTAELPGVADLAWASFPCQDLSLAGSQRGLEGERSGTFWQFWRLIKSLIGEQRAPSMVVLENVCGALTSHGGKDFTAIADALADAGYRFGALVIDAVHFVPQSRPRLFIIAVRTTVPEFLEARSVWHPPNLIHAWGKLPRRLKPSWVWWHLPAPPPRTTTFADVIEHNSPEVRWHTEAETQRLLEMMSPVNRAKLQRARRSGAITIGSLYRRTRGNQQRAEVRFDDVAGCLRTPAGGSSRQTILLVEGNDIRSRLLSAREAARLMGLPDTYRLPANYNEAYHLAGDGVVVPVVRFLAAHLLEPLLAGARPAQAA